MKQSHIPLTLVLLLVVVAPSACVLWFMMEAVQNERLALRQKLTDAYRVHLSSVQQRLDTWCNQTGQELDKRAAELSAPALFARVAASNLADAAIIFDASNHLAYPTGASLAQTAPTAEWVRAEALESEDLVAAGREYARMAHAQTNLDLAASALQAQARCLARAGQREAALGVLLGTLAEARFRSAKDPQGRLVVPNAQLMAIELSKDFNSAQNTATLEELKRRLLDYGSTDLSSSQRRFLMHELRAMYPRETVFPTLAAEELAASFIEAGVTSSAGPSLRAAGLSGVWRFDSASGRVVTLHRAEALLQRLQRAVAFEGLLPEASLTFVPPGADSQKSLLSAPAGPSMPGWRVALSVNDGQGVGSNADRRISWYVWIGVLTVVVVLILGTLALGLVRRQLALTRLRNDLVANVTHELKTPLASMRLLVDTLLDSEKLQETTAREYLQLIASENSRLSRLIDNFLAFSRMERNKRTFDFAEVPAEKLVHDAAAAVRERFGAPGCRFSVRVEPDLPQVKVDADAIVTALVNLLDNAYKYSGDEKEIALSARADNGSICFSVKDNGIGLSPREGRRVFERFYQVSQPASRVGGGCGLGLSIVKFIVTAHGGEVRVDSEPGRGSTFTIMLPIEGRASIASGHPSGS